jgi:hypothetical protein
MKWWISHVQLKYAMPALRSFWQLRYSTPTPRWPGLTWLSWTWRGVLIDTAQYRRFWDPSPESGRSAIGSAHAGSLYCKKQTTWFVITVLFEEGKVHNLYVVSVVTYAVSTVTFIAPFQKVLLQSHRMSVRRACVIDSITCSIQYMWKWSQVGNKLW